MDEFGDEEIERLFKITKKASVNERQAGQPSKGLKIKSFVYDDNSQPSKLNKIGDDCQEGKNRQ